MEPTSKPIPLLYTLYFGKNAPTAYAGSTKRLLAWSRAFDQWLDHRRRTYHPDQNSALILTWKRFAACCQKMPWQVTPGDVRLYLAWLEHMGLSASTVKGHLYRLVSFYDWCATRGIDEACGSSFNPARELPPPSVPPNPLPLWTLQEVNALLTLLSRDSQVLGKRDYAFFLARLYTGVPLAHLMNLRWGQVGQDECSTWVQWRPAAGRTPLASQIWAAILSYLQASARLEGMTPGKLIFAPRKKIGYGTGKKASDWNEYKTPKVYTLARSLQRYGRQLGIPAARLRLKSLELTALRMRLDQGESLEGMRTFMDSNLYPHRLEIYLCSLPPQPEELIPSDQQANGTSPVQPPLREADRGKFKQNMVAKFSPTQAQVQAVLSENDSGLSQEIQCLRQLMRLLLDSDDDELHKTAEYTRAANRLAALVKLQQSIQAGGAVDSEQELLETLDQLGERFGRSNLGEAVRQAALGSSAADEQGQQQIGVEMATLRLLMSNIYRQATKTTPQPDKLFHLLDLYGLSAMHLAKMLSTTKSSGRHPVKCYVDKALDQAIRELNHECGLDKYLEGEGS